MVVSFPYNINIGTAETINSSVYYRLKDSEYQSLLKAYKDNDFPLFLGECNELNDLEKDIRNSIYSENAAIYLANKDLINKILDDDKLGLNDVDIDQIVNSYINICDCDILFPKEIVSMVNNIKKEG